jgi:hypothetical protein
MDDRANATRIPRRFWRARIKRGDAIMNQWQAEQLEARVFLSAASAAAGTSAQALAALNLSTAVFVQNQGQWTDDSIKYAYNGQGINIGFTDTGPVLELSRGKQAARASLPRPSKSPAAARVAMSFDGAQATTPHGVDQTGTSYNYLAGTPSQHRTHVASYQKIQYANLYAGIDLLTSGQRDGMKYEFHVAPNANWNDIRVSYSGATKLSLGADGSLHIGTPLGEMIEQAPLLYQTIGGVRHEVAGHFVLIDANTYGFSVTGQYDASHELVIDPDLSWAAYLGGGDNDYGQAIAIDNSGNSYIAGYTASAGWATTGAYNTALKGDNDVFVAKVNATGTTLQYVTYLGGTGNDLGTGIAVDSSGNAYVTGYTQSAGWATAGAYDTSFNGVYDAFVAKLNATGSSLTYATYLGGANADYGYGIAVDSTGNSFVAGYTASAGWATAGASDTSFNGGESDAFVAKLNATGSLLTYATYLGGSNTDYANAIAIDTAGNAYVSGQTSSAGWATAGAFDASYNGGTDAFAAKVNASGSLLSYATYLGGSNDDSASGIAIDSAGNAYITGSTSSAGWASPAAYDTTQNGDSDAFVAKLSSTGAALTYATYLGGNGDDFASSIAIDSTGSAYVTGYTGSNLWAVAPGNDTASRGGYDAFLIKLSASGALPRYAANIGGVGNDFGNGIAIDNAGAAYIAGNTFSGNWATDSAFDSSQNGGSDAFVLEFTGLADPPLIPGDTNDDGHVDFADLVAVAQNYGATGKTREQGDLTGEGSVDFADLVLVAQNYGKSAPAITPAAAVPLAPKPPAKPTPFSTQKRVSENLVIK